jgi:hypothetical protein
MSNPDIIKAVVRELQAAKPLFYEYEVENLALRVVAAITPPIRDAALEEAASMVEQSTLVDYSVLKYFAADIRALKEQP